MRLLLTSTLVLTTSLVLQAQYGTFSASAVKAAKAAGLVVVLDAGDSPYNQTVMNAVKSEWKFNTASMDFVTVAELGAQPISPEKCYLLKTAKVDPEKFEGTFLTLVQGWKMKKGESLQAKDNAFTSIPSEHELTFMLIDPKAINEGNMASMIMLYIKHLQDYLKLVESGKITDKATADRTYASRTRLVRDTELDLAKEHLDKSLPDEGAVKAHYTAPMRIVTRSDITNTVKNQDRATTVSDVVITGDHKNKHCFKRLFNAGTGELMYQADDAALFGKKEGFIEVDLKNIERAR